MQQENNATETPASPIPAAALASFENLPDGNLRVKLERLGRLEVLLANGATVTIAVERDAERNWRLFVRPKHGSTENRYYMTPDAKLADAVTGMVPGQGATVAAPTKSAPKKKPTSAKKAPAKPGSGVKKK